MPTTRTLLGLGAALAALALPSTGLAETNYQVLTKTDVAVPHGQKDAGNHCDGCVTELRLPFPVRLFGVRYTRGVVSSNGNLQFTAGEDPDSFTNTSLPSPLLGAAIVPYWDDLDTDGVGAGVFTRRTGRRFVIEWRATDHATGSPVSFAVVLTKGSTRVRVVYGVTPDAGASATAGLQAAATGEGAVFSSDQAVLVPGLRVDYRIVVGEPV